MEFALVLPILVLLIFGIVDFGRLLRAQIIMTEAAREGARASALVSTAAARERGDQVTQSLAGAVTAVTAECEDPADDTTVTVTYAFEFVTPLTTLLGFGGPDGKLELTESSVMPCLR